MIIELRKWFKSLLSSKTFSERTCFCSLIRLFPEDEFVKKFPLCPSLGYIFCSSFIYYFSFLLHCSFSFSKRKTHFLKIYVLKNNQLFSFCFPKFVFTKTYFPFSFFPCKSKTILSFFMSSNS